MKTTGEPIEDISSLREGDVYVSISKHYTYISVFKMHTQYYGLPKVIDSKCFILDEGKEMGHEGLEYYPKGMTFRWPTEQELIKFGFKQRKVMFHELD